MANVKTIDKLNIGLNIRVKSGIASPEFPEFTYEGWSGTIVEQIGKKAAPKYVVEWNDATIESMPSEYRDRCEEEGLFYRMACFEFGQLEAIDS